MLFKALPVLIFVSFEEPVWAHLTASFVYLSAGFWKKKEEKIDKKEQQNSKGRLSELRFTLNKTQFVCVCVNSYHLTCETNFA